MTYFIIAFIAKLRKNGYSALHLAAKLGFWFLVDFLKQKQIETKYFTLNFYTYNRKLPIYFNSRRIN